jgi:hypothetical protein
MGAAAAQTAALHDWEKLAEKMAKVYEKLLTETKT